MPAVKYNRYKVTWGCDCPDYQTYEVIESSAEAAVWKHVTPPDSTGCVGDVMCSRCGTLHVTADGAGETFTKTWRMESAGAP